MEEIVYDSCTEAYNKLYIKLMMSKDNVEEEVKECTGIAFEIIHTSDILTLISSLSDSEAHYRNKTSRLSSLGQEYVGDVMNCKTINGIIIAKQLNKKIKELDKVTFIDVGFNLFNVANPVHPLIGYEFILRKNYINIISIFKEMNLDKLTDYIYIARYIQKHAAMKLHVKTGSMFFYIGLLTMYSDFIKGVI